MIKKTKSQLKWLIYKIIMAYWARKIDVYVVGYPKTGNTWLWLMIGRLLVQHYGLPETEVSRIVLYSLWTRQAWKDWKNLPPQAPVIHLTHNMPGFWSDPDYDFRLYMAPFMGKKIILPIRDPRDTLVSLYFHNVHRRFPPVFEGSLEEMVRDRKYGIDNFLRFYQTWYQHLGDFDDVFLVHYEDHRADPVQIARQIACFLGLSNVADSTLEDVVAFCSFDNMKKMEKDNNALTAPRSGHQNGYKVRKGKVGGFKDHMNEETIKYIDTLVAEHLPKFYGYTNCADEADVDHNA